MLAPSVAIAEVERDVRVAAPGRMVVTLDGDVYERARPDLGDLRVLDDRGQPVPFLLDRVLEDPPAPRRPEFRDRTFVRGEKVSVTLDFGAPTLKSQLALTLSGDDFRRRVVVEGRARRQPEWERLTDSAYVYAVPAPYAARYEVVPLPENNHAILRVTVYHGDDDPPRIEILDAWAPAEERRRPREAPLAPRLTRAEDAARRETVLTLDLGARHRPFRAVVLDVADPAFWRGVAVEARVEAGGEGIAWRYLCEGAIHRHPVGGEGHESLRLDVIGRERVLRLRVRNRDDRPLDVRGVTVKVPVERLAFDALPGRTYRLRYGMPSRPAPVYDLARTAGDPALFAARGEEPRLGPASPVAAAASANAWTDRHPAALWGGLVLATVALAALTWHALRAT